MVVVIVQRVMATQQLQVGISFDSSSRRDVVHLCRFGKQSKEYFIHSWCAIILIWQLVIFTDINLVSLICPELLTTKEIKAYFLFCAMSVRPLRPCVKTVGYDYEYAVGPEVVRHAPHIFNCNL